MKFPVELGIEPGWRNNSEFLQIEKFYEIESQRMQSVVNHESSPRNTPYGCGVARNSYAGPWCCVGFFSYSGSAAIVFNGPPSLGLV